jgi:hypothetical protein
MSPTVGRDDEHTPEEAFRKTDMSNILVLAGYVSVLASLIGKDV